MKLHEIEETLHTLERRHPGLNEVMLVTLLRAGGWEEKHVEEARVLFRTSPSVPPLFEVKSVVEERPQVHTPSEQPHPEPQPPQEDVQPPIMVKAATQPLVEVETIVTPQEKMLAESSKKKLETKQEDVALPPTQETPLLMPTVDEHHLLTEHVASEPSEPAAFPVLVQEAKREEERQSLVIPAPTPVVTVQNKKDELPHNLPLRPFETSEHIWPFARYRDVFYGEPEPSHPPKEEVKMEVKTNVVVAPQVTVHVEERSQEVAKVTTVVEKTIEKTQIPIVQMVQDQPVQPIAPSVPIERVPSQPIQPTTPPPTPTLPSGGDEKLVVMACIMLLTLLLLLGYMYSNGRL